MNHERIEALANIARMMKRECFKANKTPTWIMVEPHTFQFEKYDEQRPPLDNAIIAQQLNDAVAAVLAPYIENAEAELRELIKEGGE
jgi:hypothetical protein